MVKTIQAKSRNGNHPYREEELRVRQLQVADDAARASLGLPVAKYIVTDTPLKNEFCAIEKWVVPETGQSNGRIKHPDSLLRAANTLVNRSKVNAIAVVGRFPDDEIDEVDYYRQGMSRESSVQLMLVFLIFRKSALVGWDYIGGLNMSIFFDIMNFLTSSAESLPTSSATDFGLRDRLMGSGDIAGACAQGIWNSFTTR
ncbi:unnamed protein product [Sphenostylis stenocarpa]|uniref:Uncharacterized protein n=1 Tax=Sphenostylis stenocarpa TaxID=92480 RepID=A0AA86W5A7_9FABA|nr:unnamed protein product [Sphenostylis stenocarpa]